MFPPLNVTESGFFVDSDAKSLAALKSNNGKSLIISTANRDSLKIFEQKLELDPHWINPTPGDLFAEIIFLDGRKQRREFYNGSGYLSQSSESFVFPAGATRVFITDRKGRRRME